MTNAPENRRKNMRFNTQKYRQLELFIKTEPGKAGRLHMISGSARKMFRIDQYRKWMRIAVNQRTTRMGDFTIKVSGQDGTIHRSVISFTFHH